MIGDGDSTNNGSYTGCFWVIAMISLVVFGFLYLLVNVPGGR